MLMARRALQRQELRAQCGLSASVGVFGRFHPTWSRCFSSSSSAFSFDSTARESTPLANENLRVYTRAEVARHDNDEDLWIIIDSYVYNLTEWINFHPGSRDPLVNVAGQDASEAFAQIGHSEFAKQKMLAFRMGRIANEPRFSGTEYKDRIGEV